MRRIRGAWQFRVARNKVLQGLLVRGFLDLLPFTLILGGRWLWRRRLRRRLLFCELILQVLNPLFGDIRIKSCWVLLEKYFPSFYAVDLFRPGRSRPAHQVRPPTDVLGLAGLAVAPAKSNPRQAYHRRTAPVCWR